MAEKALVAGLEIVSAPAWHGVRAMLIEERDLYRRGFTTVLHEGTRYRYSHDVAV